MGQKFTESEAALYRAVDEVLHYLWDPIGVAGAPQARDEYYGYVPEVYGMLNRGNDAVAVASYLSEICTEGMGLSANPEHHLKIAMVLVQWRDVVRAKPV